ncbi:MAG TPA: tRNA epoxyqueuosine(34) reductase QueG [Bacteroidales bacterium]
MSSPNTNTANLSEFIKNEAENLGFFACGISKAEHLPEHEKHVESWLDKGMQGEMSYLERNNEKRYDPTKLVEGAKSVITVLQNYFPEKMLPRNDNFQFSKYAYGKDYHMVMKDKLHVLLQKIEEKRGKTKSRVFVDSAPVLDRAWAHKSGLGFIGKNTMLINRKGGSFFFIGHIITDLELEYEKAEPEKNFCGSCTLCLKACPTNALKPYELDARKCISYLTIEHRSDLPGKLKDKFENWIFGCDICQDVCPWNRSSSHHNEPLFTPLDSLINMKKNDWKMLEKSTFNLLFKETAVMRAGYDGLKRNIDFLETDE